MHGAAVFSAVLLASTKARINRLRTNAQSIEVCSEEPFTHSCSKLQSMYGAIVYSGMLEAPKFVRSNIFLCYALSIEVCTAADQPVYSVSNARSIEVCSEQSLFTQSCSEHRSVHGANVYTVLIGASKFARSNRLLSRARSIEVCTEQPFTQTCSEHREYAWINRFSIMSGRTLVIFLSLFCFLFQL